MGGDIKLLARMRASRFGWGENDIHALLLSFGFEWRDKGKHRVYDHPKYPVAPIMVGRHKTLGPGYVRDALSAVDDVIDAERRKDQGKSNG